MGGRLPGALLRRYWTVEVASVVVAVVEDEVSVELAFVVVVGSVARY